MAQPSRRLLSKVLTHINADTMLPTMVEVGHKVSTVRMARAEARVELPPIAWESLSRSQEEGGNKELYGPKGPVFATAVIAGTSAAKRTSEWIPFCHNIPLSGVKFDLSLDHDLRHVVIQCTAKCQGKTGVEMEAMVGASAAALTVYDMLKAVSHEITIVNTRLLEKSGGKSDFSPSQ
eukprot:TRINITY_DN4530_c0_g1_i1.p2 TRINITY_DN4530_c0_g1~~TRINITY_DN4530_c0_g1_i1.p2  ORF type:complete len:178 (+),score=37.05 TRINITY_DN4530_c0_g1_i1:406-939(+)